MRNAREEAAKSEDCEDRAESEEGTSKIIMIHTSCGPSRRASPPNLEMCSGSCTSWRPPPPLGPIAGPCRVPVRPPAQPRDMQRPLHSLAATFGHSWAPNGVVSGNPLAPPMSPLVGPADPTRRCATAVAHPGGPSWGPPLGPSQGLFGPSCGPREPSCGPSHMLAAPLGPPFAPFKAVLGLPITPRYATAVAHPGCHS